MYAVTVDVFSLMQMQSFFITVCRCHHKSNCFIAELYIGRHVQELKHVPAPLEFYRSYVSVNQPVVIRDAVKHWPAVHLWTHDYLRLFCTFLQLYCVCCSVTHTHTRLTAFFRDYPGEPVPER